MSIQECIGLKVTRRVEIFSRRNFRCPGWSSPSPRSWEPILELDPQTEHLQIFKSSTIIYFPFLLDTHLTKNGFLYTSYLIQDITYNKASIVSCLTLKKWHSTSPWRQSIISNRRIKSYLFRTYQISNTKWYQYW